MPTQIITSGSQFYTNNTALAWTVLMIESNAGVVEPSLAYLNNVLEDCSLNRSLITYYLTQSNSTGWSINPYALVWCNNATAAGIMTLQLSANILSSEIASLVEAYTESTFETPSARAVRPPEYLASPVSDRFHVGNLLPVDVPPYRRTFGLIVVHNQFNATTNIQAELNTTCTPGSTPTVAIGCSPRGADVISPGFFEYVTSTINGCPDFEVLTDSPSAVFDALTKSFYSLVLSDLGQAVPTNLLTNPGFIMELQETIPLQNVSTLLTLPIYDFSTPPSDLYQNKPVFFNWFGEYFVQYYVAGDEKIAISIPVVLPAVIATQYDCQVPQLKSTGSLLVAVLVADLVFLQVLWKVLNLAVTFSLKRRRRDANYCDGCAKRLPLPPAKEGDYELVGGTLGTATTTATRTAIAVGDDVDDNNNEDDGAATGGGGKMGVSSGKMSGEGVREEELHRHRSKSTPGEYD